MARISPLAGRPVGPAQLVDVPRLVTAYFAIAPDPAVASQRVAFGTSGHRGSSFDATFNEAHVLAVSQAVCQYRKQAGATGPLFIGIDTHALSRPALATALEVFAANEVEALIDERDGFTPTPVISHAILTRDRGRTEGLADGVVITPPPHNPPEDGGFKHNPTHGGPAGTEVTAAIQDTANALPDGRAWHRLGTGQRRRGRSGWRGQPPGWRSDLDADDGVGGVQRGAASLA